MTGRAGWRRTLKALHELAALGVGGGLAACLVIGITANIAAPAEFAAARQAIVAIARYLLLPSLALVLVTGLLAIAATRGYHDAGWAWVKALLGIGVFEAALFTVGASSPSCRARSGCGHRPRPARFAAALGTKHADAAAGAECCQCGARGMAA